MLELLELSGAIVLKGLEPRDAAILNAPDLLGHLGDKVLVMRDEDYTTFKLVEAVGERDDRLEVKD